MTPNGTDTFSMRMPLGLSNEANILPNGEGSPATFLISEVIPKIRSRESINRSYLGSIFGIRAKSRQFSCKDVIDFFLGFVGNGKKYFIDSLGIDEIQFAGSDSCVFENM